MVRPFLYPIRSRFLQRAGEPANIARMDRVAAHRKAVPRGETLPCAAALFAQNAASTNEIGGRKGTASS